MKQNEKEKDIIQGNNRSRGMSEQKSTFHETKEIVSRLREPIKIKAVPYATTKTRGHQIQLEMNISWEQIDEMTGKDSQITHMINNMISVIEGPMRSEYLGKIIMGEDEK